MGSKADERANPAFPHREPPPSLGMVAHIWAEHLAPDKPAPASEADEDDSIDLTPPRNQLFSID